MLSLGALLDDSDMLILYFAALLPYDLTVDELGLDGGKSALRASVATISISAGKPAFP